MVMNWPDRVTLVSNWYGSKLTPNLGAFRSREDKLSLF